MPDILTPERRSRLMSKVKGRDTDIEKIVRSALHRKGFRFRKNVSHLPGKPDLVLPKYRTVIFVHGCFWHGHDGCKRGKLPETRREFWQRKIEGNIERDKNNVLALEKAGWHVLLVWECAIKHRKAVEIEAALSELAESVTAHNM
jgi:DNA mismatch endonuclease (patch repair protein)